MKGMEGWMDGWMVDGWWMDGLVFVKFEDRSEPINIKNVEISDQSSIV